MSDKAEGGTGEDQISIYTHKSFDINYNGDQVGDALTDIIHTREDVPASFVALR